MCMPVVCFLSLIKFYFILFNYTLHFEGGSVHSTSEVPQSPRTNINLSNTRKLKKKPIVYVTRRKVLNKLTRGAKLSMKMLIDLGRNTNWQLTTCRLAVTLINWSLMVC